MDKGLITVKLLESDRTIINHIYEGIAEHLNKQLRTNTKNVIKTLKNSVKEWVKNQPEITSLLANGAYGSLSAHFGLTSSEAESAVRRIVLAVADSLQVKIKPITSKLKGTLEFNFQQTDFMNLLGLSEGHRTTAKGTDLHWLDWMTMKGDTTIILGYSYVAGPTGRAGGGEMNIGGMWRVPPEFSGTKTNNFITRAFEGTEEEIQGILKGLFI